jgi:hypothetical protein
MAAYAALRRGPGRFFTPEPDPLEGFIARRAQRQQEARPS